MISLLPSMILAQVVTAPTNIMPADYIIQPQEIRPLPGKLDEIPVFNSNSPEVIEREGILLSTFPADQKYNPNAHLNLRLNGRFDFFSITLLALGIIAPSIKGFWSKIPRTNTLRSKFCKGEAISRLGKPPLWI